MLIFASVARSLFLTCSIVEQATGLEGFTYFFHIMARSSRHFCFYRVGGLRVVFQSDMSSPSMWNGCGADD